jgi:hypothetical protein
MDPITQPINSRARARERRPRSWPVVLDRGRRAPRDSETKNNTLSHRWTPPPPWTTTPTNQPQTKIIHSRLLGVFCLGSLLSGESGESVVPGKWSTTIHNTGSHRPPDRRLLLRTWRGPHSAGRRCDSAGRRCRRLREQRRRSTTELPITRGEPPKTRQPPSPAAVARLFRESERGGDAPAATQPAGRRWV